MIIQKKNLMINFPHLRVMKTEYWVTMIIIGEGKAIFAM